MAPNRACMYNITQVPVLNGDPDEKLEEEDCGLLVVAGPVLVQIIA